jgi:hypothetical protein
MITHLSSQDWLRNREVIHLVRSIPLDPYRERMELRLARIAAIAQSAATADQRIDATRGKLLASHNDPCHV